MLVAALVAMFVALAFFVWVGLRGRSSNDSLDDYLTARGSQNASALGLSFVASGLGAWILFAPPELGAFVGPVAVAGYAVGAALPFLVFAAFGGSIRRMLPEGRSRASSRKCAWARPCGDGSPRFQRCTCCASSRQS